jgi:hypothetical protein
MMETNLVDELKSTSPGSDWEDVPVNFAQNFFIFYAMLAESNGIWRVRSTFFSKVQYLAI